MILKNEENSVSFNIVYIWKVYYLMLYWDYMVIFEFYFFFNRYNFVDVNVVVVIDVGLIILIVSRVDIKVGYLV